VGLETTQLYNKTLVYKLKRHGLFTFGNRQFEFRMKSRFPRKLTQAFLLLDAINKLPLSDRSRIFITILNKHNVLPRCFDNELMNADNLPAALNRAAGFRTPGVN
jgi:hypothetical protein